MPDPEVEEFNQMVGSLLARLGLPEDVPGESEEDHKLRLLNLHVAVAFPNLQSEDRSLIATTFLVVLNTTKAVNFLTLPLSKNDRAEWEAMARQAEHDQLPFLRRTLEERDVRSHLTTFQRKLFDDLVTVEFFNEEE